MTKVLKRGIEKMLGDRKFLEKAAPIDPLRPFVQSLRVTPTTCPLIRIGSDSDGGYLLPDDLEGIATLVSPGVSTEVGFDLAMAERGCEVYMADRSVDGPPVAHPRFHFVKKFLDVVDDAENLRLDTLCAAMDPAHAGDRMLQMDIEGAEYRVLMDASPEVLASFRIMLIEFHQLDRLFSDFSSQFIRATFVKLLRTHHVVHIHPNNASAPVVRGDIVIPPVMEFTFLRKDRAALEPGRAVQFPHPLDRDNVGHKPPVVLPRCWW